MIIKITKNSILLTITSLLLVGFLAFSVPPLHVGAADGDSESSVQDESSDKDKNDESSDPAIKQIPNKKDPAAGLKVDCTKDACPLISKYVNPAVRLLSALVGIVAVIAIVVGGIEVTTSAGDPQRSASGKNHIRNALIGIVAYVFLFALLQWLVPGGIV